MGLIPLEDECNAFSSGPSLELATTRDRGGRSRVQLWPLNLRRPDNSIGRAGSVPVPATKKSLKKPLESVSEEEKQQQQQTTEASKLPDIDPGSVRRD